MSFSFYRQERAGRPMSGGFVVLMAQFGLAYVLLRLFERIALPVRAPRLERRPPAPEAIRAISPAREPTEDFPRGARKVDWLHVGKRVIDDFSRHRIMALSAEMTFYSLLAIFPGVAALVSLYGLFLNPAAIESQMHALAGLMPGGGIDLLDAQIRTLVQTPNRSLGIGFVIGLAVALWSANSGMKSIFDAMNIVREREEERGFVRLTLVTLALTCGALLLVIVALAGMVAVPIVLSFIHAGGWAWAFWVARWPALFVLVAVNLALLYRCGPSRRDRSWRWITAGSGFASIAWLAASMLFSWYVANFGSYNKTYGSLGAAVGFMTWMWISGIVILLGAEIDAKAEEQMAPLANSIERKP
jgi:membrane protein